MRQSAGSLEMKSGLGQSHFSRGILARSKLRMRSYTEYPKTAGAGDPRGSMICPAGTSENLSCAFPVAPLFLTELVLRWKKPDCEMG